jgi:hypothetical protein
MTNLVRVSVAIDTGRSGVPQCELFDDPRPLWSERPGPGPLAGASRSHLNGIVGPSLPWARHPGSVPRALGGRLQAAQGACGVSVPRQRGARGVRSHRADHCSRPCEHLRAHPAGREYGHGARAALSEGRCSLAIREANRRPRLASGDLTHERAAQQRDAADEGRLEPGGSIIVGNKVIVDQGKVVRPSQLIASVRRAS